VTLTFDPCPEDDYVGAILCEACAKDWGLSDGCTRLFPDAEGEFPHVVPTCIDCYRAACARAGASDKLTLVRTDPGEDVSIDDIRAAVERSFSGSRATFVEAVEVRAVQDGQTVWEGAVKLFDLEPSISRHHTRVYAWSYPVPGNRRRFMTLRGKVKDPSAIVREHGSFWEVWRKPP
jgi:hypothetical protein